MSRFFQVANPVTNAMGLCLTAMSLSALCGCADQATGPDEAALTDLRSAERTYPPGAAQVLSIAGPIALPEGRPFDTAVNCAAAIRVTTQFTSQMSAGIGKREIGFLRQAEQIYRERAAGAADEESQVSGPAAIEQRLADVQASPQSQAQLAISCIRNLSAI